MNKKNKNLNFNIKKFFIKYFKLVFANFDKKNVI